jgi:DNA-binding transcriptional regulator YiaG
MGTQEIKLIRRDLAVALRREGKTAAEITKATGLSYYHQRKLYNAHNISAPSRYGANRRRIIELLNAGKMSQSEIARTLGVSRQLVSGIKRSELEKEVDA